MDRKRHTPDPRRHRSQIPPVAVRIRRRGVPRVQTRDAEIAPPDKPVVDQHDCARWHAEDGVRAQEGEEGAGAGDDLPGDAKGREEGAEDLPADDVEVAGNCVVALVVAQLTNIASTFEMTIPSAWLHVACEGRVAYRATSGWFTRIGQCHQRGTFLPLVFGAGRDGEVWNGWTHQAETDERCAEVVAAQGRGCHQVGGEEVEDGPHAVFWFHQRMETQLEN
ncbi:hypothetical protein ASPCAL10018 [Aspergillus calidoustus]|uniref:Uncharacterized protein n=1 Tax=Aspergillus calidoustus TaxID=454130 RepID=A0A0U5G8B4_ASPCI|nr:hypothetical protein ASPCAL10018 [Aspergillus calidoustus]